MTRPSARATDSVVSVQETVVARGVSISSSKVVMPCLLELLLVLRDVTTDEGQLTGRET
jgi:hypothetical protein